MTTAPDFAADYYAALDRLHRLRAACAKVRAAQKRAAYKPIYQTRAEDQTARACEDHLDALVAEFDALDAAAWAEQHDAQEQP